MKKLLNELSFTTLLVSSESDDSNQDSKKFTEINQGGWTASDGSAQVHIQTNGEVHWVTHQWDGDQIATRVLYWKMTSNASEFLEGELQIENIFVPVRFTQSGEKLIVEMLVSNESLVIEFDKWEA